MWPPMCAAEDTYPAATALHFPAGSCRRTKTLGHTACGSKKSWEQEA